MADKPTIQKHEKSIAALEEKLGTFESFNTATQEQMGQLKMDVAMVRQSNFEVKTRLDELTALLKKEVLGRASIPGGNDAPTSDIVTLVSSNPQTPTHIATIESSVSSGDMSNFRSINWSGSTITPFPRPINPSQPTLHTTINPTTPPGFFVPQTQFLTNSWPNTSFPMPQPTTGLASYQPPYIQSTLNPYALPLYPHFTQNSVSTPQNHYSTFSQPTANPIHPNSNPQNIGFIPSITTPYKTPKLDFPKFDGKDPRGWLNKCEKFFQLNPTTDLRSRVLCAALHMENDADIWYRTVEREKSNLLWPEFCNLVCQRFSKVGYENLVGQFNKLTQKGRVEEYITQFDELRNYVMAEEGFHRESYYIDNFISGLKDDIAQHLYNQKPKTMQEARDLARGQKFFLTVLDKRYRAMGTHTKTLPKSYPTRSFSDNTGSKPPTEGFKKLSLAELTEKRQKGLCYHCDQKYEPGHDCRKKKLFVLIGDEEVAAVQNEEELTITWEGCNTEQPQEDECAAAKVSLHAMNGSQGSGTIKLQGNIQGHLVNILVDSGSTHDFMSQNLAKRLQLKTNPCAPFSITVADGNKVQCNTTVEPVKWSMADEVFSTNMHLIPLGGYDIILGAQWMTTVSPVTFDYAKGMITVNHQGKRVGLQQFTNPAKVQLRLKKGNNKFHKEEAYFLIQVTTLEGLPNVTDKLPNNISQVLEDYVDVFASPTQLPPPRNHDHHIPLKAGSEPVNSHPYRCPLAHREEIEKITKEMLEAGVIKASTSPYSSPVLLVRKKDNTWRLVVDYRALNAITVKNKFPIPVIEELLAELKGSTVYFKLDLRSGYHQIKVHENDTYKTAFKTHQGHFEFLVMPFGLTNAPASFQALMNEVFAEYLRKFVLVFFDDILVYSSNLEEHEHQLKLVFDKLRAHKCLLREASAKSLEKKLNIWDISSVVKGLLLIQTRLKP
ncbi:uncharacterized protein LOC135147942 [Daucus carota subsp. sativus]|uniref:uncharacterized protein LOC135147942 n=1 Tax=Daucus carota subsp. sativus TaxID=79200 RepID=UPI003082BA2F